MLLLVIDDDFEQTFPPGAYGQKWNEYIKVNGPFEYVYLQQVHIVHILQSNPALVISFRPIPKWIMKL